MTFVEELKKLSEKADLKHKLDRQFAELKVKMRTAASYGIHSFKIEIFTIEEAPVIYLPEIKDDNYYCFYTTDEAFYVSELINFLVGLGFDAADFLWVKQSTAGYSSMSAIVEW